jgi:hypothetical protein
MTGSSKRNTSSAGATTGVMYHGQGSRCVLSARSSITSVSVVYSCDCNRAFRGTDRESGGRWRHCPSPPPSCQRRPGPGSNGLGRETDESAAALAAKPHNLHRRNNEGGGSRPEGPVRARTWPQRADAACALGCTGGCHARYNPDVRRIILNGLTVLSVVLCVATVAFWVLSYHAVAVYGLPRTRWTGNFGTVSSAAGRLEFAREFGGDGIGPVRVVAERRFPGITYRLLRKGSEAMDSIAVSFWLPVAMMTVLPSVQLLARIRRPRTASGACVACGYDLRATPDRCPECGTIVTRVDA